MLELPFRLVLELHFFGKMKHFLCDGNEKVNGNDGKIEMVKNGPAYFWAKNERHFRKLEISVQLIKP